MDQNTFLADVRQSNDNKSKYRIIGQFLELMIKGIESQKDEFNRFLVTELCDVATIEIVDQFLEAFSDLENLKLDGIARITTRLFLNLRGMEISVWTAKDEMYTIFVSFSASDLHFVIKTLTKYHDPDEKVYRDLLSKLSDVEYQMKFPQYKNIQSKYKDES